MRRAQPVRGVIGSIAVGVVLLSAITSSAGEETALLAESPRYRLYFQDFLPLGPAEWGIVLEIHDKRSKRTHITNVQEALMEGGKRRDYIKAAIVGNRSVILGDRAHGDQLVVLQLKPPSAVEKSILCLFPSISQVGKRVVYQNWIRRFIQEEHTVVLSVLDVCDDDLKTYVIYPPDNAKRQDPKPYVEKPEGRRLRFSPISWSGNDERIVFFELFDKPREFYLVEVDFSKGLDAAISYRTKIDVDQLLKKGANPSGSAFWVKKITWLDEKRIEGTFSHKKYCKSDKLILPLPSAGTKCEDRKGSEAEKQG